MNTSVKQKEELWPIFIKACESQWRGGGKRYALNEEKEFTDLVTEAVGDEWILGNIIKYCGEIINTIKTDGIVPEVNCFKITIYSFLYWLKKQGQFTKRDKGEEFEI